MTVETWDGGRCRARRFWRGWPVEATRDLGATERHGVRVTLVPDCTIFGRYAWNRTIIADRLRELAALAPSLTTILDHDAFRCPEGLADHVRFMARGRRLLHREPLRVTSSSDAGRVDAALAWTDARVETILGFVRNEEIARGSHVDGFIEGLLTTVGALDPARFGGVHRAALREVVGRGLVAAVMVDFLHSDDVSFERGRVSIKDVRMNVEVPRVVQEQLGPQLAAQPELVAELLSRAP